ncbi:MAG: DUF4097 family beta strand repeat protein [Candidatus Krumholzibacteria bacterium]|nr:DUF4097 family beta strand repeat protein [Candidatus Krumholzibacteria bacterium]
MKSNAKTVFLTVLATLVALAVLPQTGAVADKWTIIDDDDWCDEGWWDRSEHVCEIRETTIKADWETIRVDAGVNGGITVEGWNKNEIRIRAKIKAWDRDEDDAREIMDEIEIKTSNETIIAKGPKLRGSKRGWAVSYEVMVPRKSNLDLETLNGGIGIEDVEGEIEAEAVNGGLRLSQLAGDVDVHTTNGGVSVELHGKKWNGRGLDASTTNGGVKVWIPEDYNAELETGTVNGSVDFDFPITVQGKISKKIKATLGDGGPKIRVTTTNGGVRLKKG